MSEKSDLIMYRLKQAEETLRTAKFLLENQKDIPSIANRLYYACFYALLALVVEKEIGTSKHTGVISTIEIMIFNRTVASCNLILKYAFRN